MKLTLAKEMLYTTVKLTGFAQGRQVGTGTGFFWRIVEGAGHVVLLATNKHVIEGCDYVNAICHTSTMDDRTSPCGQMISIGMSMDTEGTFQHPDEDVDLVMFGFSGLVDSAEANNTPLFFKTLSAVNVPSVEKWASFDAIEDVLMIGYPRGISDEVNNRPIVRRGITATALGLYYNGKSEFLVDMACFPGSSGSPVFMNQLGYLIAKAKDT